MYVSKPNLIIGFHGCEKDDQVRLLEDVTFYKKSNEDYDWLGHGMYFWENNQERAMQWALQKKKAGTLKEPAVAGAVLDLGYCFDLLDSSHIQLLIQCYNLFKKESKLLDKPIPKNLNHPKHNGPDKVLRFLDCAVIQYTQNFLVENGERPFDSVRAVFVEGNPIYPDAGFNEKSHIQICIINPNCIKGIFKPRSRNNKFHIV